MTRQVFLEMHSSDFNIFSTIKKVFSIQRWTVHWSEKVLKTANIFQQTKQTHVTNFQMGSTFYLLTWWCWGLNLIKSTAHQMSLRIIKRARSHHMHSALFIASHHRFTSHFIFISAQSSTSTPHWWFEGNWSSSSIAFRTRRLIVCFKLLFLILYAMLH